MLREWAAQQDGAAHGGQTYPENVIFRQLYGIVIATGRPEVLDSPEFIAAIHALLEKRAVREGWVFPPSDLSVKEQIARFKILSNLNRSANNLIGSFRHLIPD